VGKKIGKFEGLSFILLLFRACHRCRAHGKR
jgi:hypothetical protein